MKPDPLAFKRPADDPARGVRLRLLPRQGHYGLVEIAAAPSAPSSPRWVWRRRGAAVPPADRVLDAAGGPPKSGTPLIVSLPGPPSRVLAPCVSLSVSFPPPPSSVSSPARPR